MSQAESLLAMQIQAIKLPKPEREYRFHPKRMWRFDLAWPERMVACEVEGGVFSGGRHTRGVGFTGDCEKYSEAAIAGWKVIRVTPTHIQQGRALEWIERALKEAA